MAGGAAIGSLLPDDVPSAAALSAAIGWNQDESDWARLVELHPEGAYAARLDGELVGTTTLVRYDAKLAWLGMVIVHPSRRGLGIGAALVEAALTGAGTSVIGLDATDLGAPLYQRRGFASVATIDRWAGILQATPAGGTSVRRGGGADVDRIARFDARFARVDRAGLLARLSREPGTAVVLAERGGSLVGYGALRSGRELWHVGPVVAVDEAALRAMLSELTQVASGRPVFLDAVRGPDSGTGLARFGLAVARTLQRMARPPDRGAVMIGPELVAATGLEWG